MTLQHARSRPPTTRPAALHAADLRHGFTTADGARTDVLRGAELRARPTEIVTVSGRSGSGKTTLLTLLAGFDTPEHGSVTIDDRPATTAPWWTCALLPQALGLATELTAAENVALPLRLRHTGASGAHRKAVALLDELGLDEHGDRYPQELSFGQQQRVALARAVVIRPIVLLVDEPTAHLDPDSTATVLALLRRVADDGSAIVAVTHDPSVRRIADRRLHLTGGRLTSGEDTPH